MQYQNKVIIAALDWGLGHAARLVPVIEYFVDNNCEVALASSAKAFLFLKQRFPKLKSYELPAYDIKYNAKSMVMNMMLQLPKIQAVISKENESLKKILNDFKADLIISDNRYGIFHKDIPSVFITHQLQILPPKYLSVSKPILLSLHKKMLENFSQIWVPDFQGKNSIAGELSQINKPSNKTYYIGALSRFKVGNNINNSDSIDYPKILFLISGPEPSRTNFENTILKQLENYKGKSIVLRGMASEELLNNNTNIEIHNHLDDNKLQSIIESSDLIVSRSGYSSIMDVFYLNKKAVFIPTDGQTEQEYLADKLMKEKKFYSQKLKDFDINKIISEYTKYTGFEEGKSIFKDQITIALNSLEIEL